MMALKQKSISSTQEIAESTDHSETKNSGQETSEKAVLNSETNPVHIPSTAIVKIPPENSSEKQNFKHQKVITTILILLVGTMIGLAFPHSKEYSGPSQKEVIDTVRNFEKQVDEYEQTAKQAFQSFGHTLRKLNQEKVSPEQTFEPAHQAAQKAKRIALATSKKLEQIQINKNLPESINFQLQSARKTISDAYSLRAEAINSFIIFLKIKDMKAADSYKRGMETAPTIVVRYALYIQKARKAALEYKK